MLCYSSTFVRCSRADAADDVLPWQSRSQRQHSYTDFTCLTGVVAALVANTIVNFGFTAIGMSHWHYEWRRKRRARRTALRLGKHAAGGVQGKEETLAEARAETLCEHFLVKIAEFISITIIIVLLLSGQGAFEALSPAHRRAVLHYVWLMLGFETFALLTTRTLARLKYNMDAFHSGVMVLQVRSPHSVNGIVVFVLSAVHVSQDVVLAQVDVALLSAGEANAAAARQLVEYFAFAAAAIAVAASYLALGRKFSSQLVFRI